MVFVKAHETFVCHFQLPVKIDIIKHPNETDGKSTAVQARLLAPQDVTIYTYPCIPELDQSSENVSKTPVNPPCAQTTSGNTDACSSHRSCWCFPVQMQ